MAIVTGDRYLEYLVKFVEEQAGPLLEGTIVLKLNPVGLHYVQSRLEAFVELESLIAGAPVDYLRAYISDLGDHRALEQLRRILRLLTSLKVVSVLPPQARDPTPLSLLPFGRLKVLELRGCDLSTSAARGLLELRHTLERIICHNSTDALRHVFASRIAEIKDSPNWNRLQFASCSCNRLVLMDESLQLLPAVETLDLSRNRFTRVDNLRKCTKLKHLDLGFNHLRTIASISEVTSHIVRLVLRNNALTTLRGIENLKSIEELDLSYNVISHFSEIEILASLPLQSLWLEGNPICCARWYRAQVFSFFAYPDKLKLDEKVISTREFWKRQIIIASRQKRPASFGFYSPAKDDAEGEGSGNPKRKNLCRLACIESEEQSMSSDQDSVSCENGVRSRDEDILSNDGAEVVDLMNRIELMKKERSVLWLREFKDWMDQASGNSGENGSYSGLIPSPGGRNYLKNNKMQMHHGEGLRYVSDSIQASGDDSSTNVLESDNSFADVSTNPHTPKYFDQIVQVGSKYAAYVSGDDCASGMGRMASVPSQSSHRKVTDVSGTSLVAIDDIMESGLSSACPASPPHYQEDILHRRHNLVEEILQLSAESYSAASSDSNTSCSEDDICEFGPIIPDVDRSLFEESSHKVIGQNSSRALAVDKYIHPWHEASYITKNVSSLLNSCADQASSTLEHVKPDQSLQLCRDKLFAGCQDCEIANFVNQGTEMSDKRCKKKPKKRVVSELDENNTTERAEKSEKLRGDLGAFIDLGDQLKKRSTDGNDIRGFRDNKQTFIDAVTSSLDSLGVLYGSKHSFQVTDEFVQNYFNSHLADCQVSETCRKYLRCHCMIEQQSRCGEVAVILSNENVMYLLHVDVTFDGSGTILRLLGRHRAEDVREVFVGLGLQIVRVSIEKDVSYLFVTRSIENSRRLLDVLQASDSSALNYKCPLRSLELVQIELFEELICGGLKISIFQYSMVLFGCNNDEEEIWLSRSLFVIGGHLLVCIEDLIQFSSLSVAASATPYFSLDSCCSIAHISEMVIDTRGCQCVTLVLESATSEFSRPAKEAHRAEEVAAFNNRETASRSLTWKLKWFSEENLFKFAALVKAMHAGITMSPLLVRSIP